MNKFTVLHIGGTDEFEAHIMERDELYYTFSDKNGDEIHIYSTQNVIRVSVVYAE